jgi:chromosome segregation protein
MLVRFLYKHLITIPCYNTCTVNKAMYLTKLELQGFKTFAKKTELSFLAPKKDRKPITTVVGPNGSGKSNLADAIRWVLGEQSLKLLRGKKSEDIIFSGSEGRGRAGFAEISLTFNNEDGIMPIDYSQVVITRRLFRDGNSEYLLNDSKVRLNDIQLLLAQANVGQRSYSVIGQGMIDHILVSTPEERKVFFDDATGVKQFQIKRHEAMLKLKRTHENLADVEMLLKEIEPRLRSLKRQARRLEQREEVESQLYHLEHHYYGTQWWTLVDQLEEVRERFTTADKEIETQRTELKALEQEAEKFETEDTQEDSGLQELQQTYRNLQRERNAIRDEQFKTEKEIELTKVRAQSNWAPLPLIKILDEVKAITTGLKGLKTLEALPKILQAIDELLYRSQDLSKRLERPNPKDIKPDPKLTKMLKELKSKEDGLVSKLKQLEQAIDSYATKEKTVRTELIESQRTLREKQKQIHLLENKRNSLQIDLARFEERQQSLIREMDEFMKDRAIPIRTERNTEGRADQETYAEIQRFRYKLELIGGIDPEIIQEYEEIRERHEFLDVQVKDLHGALRSTEKVIKELDDQIAKQSKKAFTQINREFQRYFKMLFGGGSCALVKVTREELDGDEQEGVTPERAFIDTGEAQREREDRIAEKLEKHQSPIVGVDIQATPPGKKMKALNLLSGGERALTSIALVSAIMAVNPAPFVVLDEVDAALDEANTLRFANILEELSANSQFIIITHNRATMEKADLLYGVTMSDDGVSNLISVHLEDVVNGGTARR